MILTAFLSGCGDTTDAPIVKEIQNIQIIESNLTIYATTNQLQIHSQVNYDDGSSADVTEACAWESDDYDTIGISYGKAFATANGDGNGSEAFVTLSASYRGFEDSEPIRLIPVTELTINDLNETNGSGYTNTLYTFSATAKYGDGTIKDVDENNSLNVEWIVDGNISAISINNGKASIEFGVGESNVTVFAFDINDTYHINIVDINDTNDSNGS